MELTDRFCNHSGFGAFKSTRYPDDFYKTDETLLLEVSRTCHSGILSILCVETDMS